MHLRTSALPRLAALLAVVALPAAALPAAASPEPVANPLCAGARDHLAWRPFSEGLCDEDVAERRLPAVLPAVAECLSAQRGDGPCPLWLTRYDTERRDDAVAVAADPDGTSVYVTGRSATPGGDFDFVTVAYDLQTGAQRWHSVLDAGAGNDIPYALAVSPAGDRVFVAGSSKNPDGDADYLVVAYEADSGQRVWSSRYDGPMPEAFEPGVFTAEDRLRAMAVSADGHRLYLTGSTQGDGTITDYTTVAVDTGDGRIRWSARYDGPGRFFDDAWAVAVAPDSATVYVTGGSHTYGTNADGYDYATVAYDAATGQQRWVARYGGLVQALDFATAVTPAPDGGVVFVTGTSWDVRGAQYDYVTFAHDAVGGQVVWKARYNGRGNGWDTPWAMTPAPDGSRLYVTGESERARQFARSTDKWFDYATVAYDTATGRQDWAVRYNGRGDDFDGAYAVAASPDGSRVYVTGSSGTDRMYAHALVAVVDGVDYLDYLTVAYDAATGDERWAARQRGGPLGYDAARSVALDPSGERVVVTGSLTTLDTRSYAFGTVAYGAGAGGA